MTKEHRKLLKEYKKLLINRDMWKYEFELLVDIVHQKNELLRQLGIDPQHSSDDLNTRREKLS